VLVPGLRVRHVGAGERGHAILELAGLNVQPLWPAILTADSGSGASGRHLLFCCSQQGGQRSAGYWVPAAQVPDGLAVLPLDGVFEQVGQLPAGGDAGDVGYPAAGPD
jgi:hypothetical protein